MTRDYCDRPVDIVLHSISLIGYVTYGTSWFPHSLVKPQQLVWRSGIRRRVLDLQMNYSDLKIGHHDSNPDHGSAETALLQLPSSL